MWETRERGLRYARKRRGLPEVDPEGPGFDVPVLFEFFVRRFHAAGCGYSRRLEVGPIPEACARLGVNPADVIAHIDCLLAEVETDPETDALAVAMRDADRLLDHFRDPGREPRYTRLLALACALSLTAPAGSFFALPVERIAAWLGVDRHTAGRVIRKLDADGAIRLRRDEDGKQLWSYKRGECRLAKYSGPKINTNTKEV